jgi:tripartite-type tricarboxylate transporter receptor subunit TctC
MIRFSFAKTLRISLFTMTLSVGLLVNVASSAAADGDSSDFYKGKTITIFVGVNPGGSFDLLARVLARHISKYIPGNPAVIVKNMPGAGYLVATKHVYRLPGDGLNIVASHGGVVNRNITGVEKGDIDALRFEWLGQVGAGAVPRLFSVRPEIATGLDQFLKVQKTKTVYIGTVGAGTTLHEFAKLLEIVGLNVKLISYKAGPEIWGALEKKEVDAISAGADTVPDHYRRFYDEKIVAPIFFHGPRLTFPSDFPYRSEDIPTFDDLAQRIQLSDDLKRLNEYLVNAYRLFRVYALPPGTPADRVKMLRQAFMKVWEEDPQAQKDARRIIARLEAYSGEEVESIIRNLGKTPPNVIALYHEHFAAGAK